jgi:hypothetical protein
MPASPIESLWGILKLQAASVGRVPSPMSHSFLAPKDTELNTWVGMGMGQNPSTLWFTSPFNRCGIDPSPYHPILGGIHNPLLSPFTVQGAQTV